MSGFTPEWLALREPADVAARSATVTNLVVDAVTRRAPLRVLDLGCGTGSNVRYLSRVLPEAHTWRLVDHDEALLAVARTKVPMPVETRVSDLRQLDAALFAECDLVTASALLDLVSEAWTRQFVHQCRLASAAVLVALNYDGRIICSPAEEDDRLVRDLVNLHQRTDKGFGPALGPDAGPRVDVLLRQAGYDVLRSRSDWLLEPADAALQRELLAGWAAAASEFSQADADRIQVWQNRRLEHVDAGVSRLLVGHDDVGAVLR